IAEDGTPMNSRMTFMDVGEMSFVLYPNIYNSRLALDAQGNIVFVRHERLPQLGRGTGYESGVLPRDGDLAQGVRSVQAVTDQYGRLLHFELPTNPELRLNEQQMQAMESLLRLPENQSARQAYLAEYPYAIDSAYRRGYDSVLRTIERSLRGGQPQRFAVLPATGNPPFQLRALGAGEAAPPEALGSVNVSEFQGRPLHRGFRPGRFRFEVEGNVPREAIELFEWIHHQTEDPQRLSLL
ncbi:MAG: hypothetical protein R3257_05570, partial [bacterium]|nr:hypothetical protein [bacterium]